MGSARTSAALRKLCMFNRRSVPRIIVAPCHSHSFFPFSLAYHNIFHCWVNDLSRIHMLICVRPQNKCPFSQELQSEGNKKSLYKQISNHLKKHLSHSSGHLCLFSAVRFCARYVNCLWKSHRSSYEAGHAKRNKKKPVSDDMWIYQHGRSLARKPELAKAARPKQTMVMWTTKIKELERMKKRINDLKGELFKILLFLLWKSVLL